MGPLKPLRAAILTAEQGNNISNSEIKSYDVYDEFLCILKYFLYCYYSTNLTKYLKVCSVLKHTLKKKLHRLIVIFFLLFFPLPLQVSMTEEGNHCQSTMQKSLDLMNGYVFESKSCVV